MLDDLGTDLESFLDVHRQVQRGVLPVAQLDDAGNADKVHPAAEIEAADDRRSGENQDRQVLMAFHQGMRSEEHTSELQSLMRISYAVFCLKKNKNVHKQRIYN